MNQWSQFPELLDRTALFLAIYFGLAAALNVGFAVGRLLNRRRGFFSWLLVGITFGILSGLVLYHARFHETIRPGLPPQVRDWANAASCPLGVFLGIGISLGLFYALRRWLVAPNIAWSFFNLTVFVFGLSLADPYFVTLVSRPDSIPIVGLVFALGFFTWLATYQMVDNDRRQAEGRPVQEKDGGLGERTFTWPELPWMELICMLVICAILIAWSLLVSAPLEEPADPNTTPNPSKAPWYFVGLQELLVYFDAWFAGVVIPLLIIVGLAAIPYLDRDTQGSGFYGSRGRRTALTMFLFGFWFWTALMIVGVFFRGPNWSMFGPFEPRDPERITLHPTYALSDFIWSDQQLATLAPMVRELPGVIAMGIYFIAFPIMARYWCCRETYQQLGPGRFALASLLGLTMLLLPLKIVLYEATGMRYFISLPEYLFYF